MDTKSGGSDEQLCEPPESVVIDVEECSEGQSTADVHTKFVQRGISVSDNAISSHQLPTARSFIVRKLSGVLSTLLELRERATTTNAALQTSSGALRNQMECDEDDSQSDVKHFLSESDAYFSHCHTSFTDEAKGLSGGEGVIGVDDSLEADRSHCPACESARNCAPALLQEEEEEEVGVGEFSEKCASAEWLQCAHFSHVGALCEACTAQHRSERVVCFKHNHTGCTSASFDSLYSFGGRCSNTSRETCSERLCRICHCPSSLDDPLISPCRCSGTLKFVHMSCLLHWLTICSRKLRRPPVCELCLYKYRRRRIFKWREFRLPTISKRDFGYLTTFVLAFSLMCLSAVISFLCFYLERKFGIVAQTKEAAMSVEGREWESVLSSATLASAIVFFFGLFVAMYAHVKTEVSLVRYLIECWRGNLEWVVEEYRASRDERYSLKLQQLRRKINGEQQGSRVGNAEESCPLRATHGD